MPTLLAQVAPQRSTQYSALASVLAPHELRLSPLGPDIGDIETCTLAGQTYLRFEMTAEPDDDQARELGMLAMTSAFFVYHEHLGRHAGPFLRPVETGFEPALPADMVMTRRYRGKTNEMFTHFLCNVARFSSDYARHPWTALRVLDPLAGGGTTLLMAMVLGADAAGVEKNANDVQTTAAFIRNYAREHRIPCRVKEDRVKRLGKRWWFTLGKETPRQCLLARGDTADSVALTAGFKRPHLVIADLPYGIQHHGQLTDLLAGALPAWEALLLPGGVMALAWESSRFPRAALIDFVASNTRLAVLDGPPYDALAHRVDRVIKQRDVLIARQAGGES